MGLNSIARVGQRLVNSEVAKLAQQYGKQVGKVNKKGWAAFEKSLGGTKTVTTIDLNTGKVKSLYESSGNITRNINYTRFDEHGAVEMFRHTKKGTGFYRTNSLSNTGDVSERHLDWNTITGNGTLTKTLNGKTTLKKDITMPVKNRIV